MAIVGSDFHADMSKVRRFLAYKPEELHIYAGDVVDSWDIPPPNCLACLQAMHESNAILIYGNHELSYHPDPMARLECSGQTTFGRIYYHQYLDDERWLAAYAVDSYLITHAGYHCNHKISGKSAEALAKKLNKLFLKRNFKLWQIGYYRGGMHLNGSIFWYDYLHDKDKLSQRYNQVFGHTQSKVPWEDKQDKYHHVCINTDDRSSKLWIFDTTTKEIVELI